ncbi:MAG: tRNA (adenosine(37)-N6)-threonylcarbamoyltransferase complex dimerization subunit type 1 TsaB [Angelakisella sp.]
MKILALEASSAAGSAAVCEEDKVIGESFLHTAKTHSQTLLPMTEQLLCACDTTLSQLDFLAVTVGPGSFTGLRIAIAAVKGMAMGADKPCVGVSMLEALAYNLRGFEGIGAAVMDARCEQVYTALFALEDGKVRRLTPDMAIPLTELSEMLQNEKKTIFLVGDGAEMCYTKLQDNHPSLRLAPAALRLARAASVAACAFVTYEQEGAIEAGALLPSYLRLPQAERELLARS